MTKAEREQLDIEERTFRQSVKTDKVQAALRVLECEHSWKLDEELKDLATTVVMAFLRSDG